MCVNPEFTKRLFPQDDCLLLGLVYLHSAGLVHRDIKPGNILVSHKGDVKLCDLGVSFDALNEVVPNDEAEAEPSAGADEGDDPRSWLPPKKRRSVDQRGEMDFDSFTGTPKYMAPEAVSSDANTPLSDVWSLGISTIEMATGKCPHGDINPVRAMLLTRQEPAPRLDPAAGHSKTLVDFVERCLQKDPVARLPTSALAGHKLIKVCMTVTNGGERATLIREVDDLFPRKQGKPKGSKLNKLIQAHTDYMKGKDYDSGSSDEEESYRDGYDEWDY